MKPYRADARCVKCGYNIAASKYWDTTMRGGVVVDCDGFIVRTCKRCGYVWDEKPLDSLGQAKPSA
jgi:predicted nucleic-acid-binding Zn-ribbon protein